LDSVKVFKAEDID